MLGATPDSIRKEVEAEISRRLDSVGLMYRIFSRIKDRRSLQKKLDSNPKYGIEKKLQDLIGLRVVLYFNDDVHTVREIVSSIYTEESKDVSIDEVRKEEFKAVRFNIVYRLPEDNVLIGFADSSSQIDTTFELQIRTVFSEGWHEVEHDLRYKCSDDWSGFDRQSRLLNGVYASLESSEWTMIKIFDELAYEHYQAKQWSSMLRQKLRLRFSQSSLNEEIVNVFDNDNEIAKQFFRFDRDQLIREMNQRDYFYPITLDNIVFFMNIISINNSSISDLTPKSMATDMTFPDE